MGISLLGCADPNPDACAKKIYDTICRRAERLVPTGEAIERELGIPIVNKRISVTPMHTIKPLDTELVLNAARETGAIVTSEEANVLGGLGGAVAEFVAENCPVPVVRHGVNDEFGRSGKAPLVLEAFGITPEGIAEKAKKAIALKK